MTGGRPLTTTDPDSSSSATVGAIPALRAAAETVASRPVSLWLLLVAVNALFQPYSGFIHDARLYAAQTLYRLNPDAWAGDLFFRYGSQDKFTAFPIVAAPVVRALGPEAGFALLYLLGAGLFCFATQRVCLRLVNDRPTAVAAAVLVVSWRITFGGGQSLHVFEPFLTPRLFSIGFTLLALNCGLDRRWLSAAGWLAVGFALHPLMAFGGVLLIGGLWAAGRPWLALSGAAVVSAAVGVVMAAPDLGFRVFGEFDPEWREGVWRINPCNFVASWQTADLIRTAGAIAVAALAAIIVPRLRLLAALTAVLGAVAFSGNILAENLPYALLMQGQPYRSLWLVAFLQVPLAFAVLETWGTAADWPRRLAAALLVGWVSLNVELPKTWLLALAGMAALGVLARPRVLAGAAVGFTLIVFPNSLMMAKGLASMWEMIASQFDPPMWLRLTLEQTNPVVRCAVAAGLLLAVARWPRFGVVLGLIGLAPVVVFGPLTRTDAYQRLTFENPEVRFVADYLRAHPRPDGRRPTVYFANTELARIWFNVGANSYFCIPQLNGNLFNRGTAIEGRRRVKLVRALELPSTQLVDSIANQFWASALATSYEVEDIGTGPRVWPPPTATDVERLCADPAVDWLVLWYDIPGYVTATNGTVYVIDADAVRRKARPE